MPKFVKAIFLGNYAFLYIGDEFVSLHQNHKNKSRYLFCPKGCEPLLSFFFFSFFFSFRLVKKIKAKIKKKKKKKKPAK